MAATAAAIINFSTRCPFAVSHRQIRVLTVDSHQLVQEGLGAMINRENDMTVVATASTGEEALDCVRQFRPDVVTLDLLLPDIPGEDVARQILAEFPQTRIVAITLAQGHAEARRALDAGVHGYLSKGAPRCDLVHAIRKVQAGGTVLPGPVAFQIGRADYRECTDGTPTSGVPFGRWGQSKGPVLAQLSIAGETVRMQARNFNGKLAVINRTRGDSRSGPGIALAAGCHLRSGGLRVISGAEF